MSKMIGDLSADLVSSLQMVVEHYLEHTLHHSRIEVMRFSGEEADVIPDPGGAVFLRCFSSRVHDGNGVPHEFVCRLAAVNGHWHVPRSPCEVLVFIPAGGLGTFPGGPLVFHVHNSPREKVTRDRSFLELDDETTLAATGGGFAFRTKSGTTFGVDKDTGAFTIALPNGTHVQLDPATNTIQLAVCDGGTPNNVLAALKLSADGIEVMSQSPTTGKKQIWKLDAASGHARLVGTGTFFATYANGALGKTPTMALGVWTGTAPGPSAGWFATPI